MKISTSLIHSNIGFLGIFYGTVGYCVIYYENIENFPDSKISVDVLVIRYKSTLHFKPSDSILLSIDYTGDFYYLEVPGSKKRPITSIVVNRYGCQDSQVSEYSFYLILISTLLKVVDKHLFIREGKYY